MNVYRFFQVRLIFLPNRIVYLHLKIQHLKFLIPFEFHRFLYWCFLSTHSQIFFETIIVSRCCLKFLSNKICSYCKNGALVKIICASSTGIAPFAATAFLDSNNFSTDVSKKSFIL